MYVSDAWSGDRPRRLVTLILGALYVTFLAVPYLRDLPALAGPTPESATPWFVAAAIVGVLLLGMCVYFFVKASSPKIGVLKVLPGILVLLTPVPALLGLQPEIGLVFVFAAFLMTIRDLARGHAMTFSVIAVFGILLISSIFMADAEAEAAQGRMWHWWQAMFWGAGQIFHFNRAVDIYDPQSNLGKWIGIAVVLAGVLFSAVLLSALTSWAVNSSRKGKDAKANDKLISDAVDKAMARALAVMSGPAAAAAFVAASAKPEVPQPVPAPGEQRVWIDVERIVGSQPMSWWESRRVTVPAYVERLRSAGPSAIPPLSGSSRVLLVAVVEGGGRAEPEGETVTASGERLVVVHAADSTADEIADRVRAGDVVVTDDPALLQTLQDHDVTVVAPVGSAGSSA